MAEPDSLPRDASVSSAVSAGCHRGGEDPEAENLPTPSFVAQGDVHRSRQDSVRRTSYLVYRALNLTAAARSGVRADRPPAT